MQRQGLDVSSYQSPVNFNKMKSNGVEFVFLRSMTCYMGSTDGKLHLQYDPSFKNFWTNAKVAKVNPEDVDEVPGIDRGAYALIDYTGYNSISGQANTFCDRFLGDYGELQPVLDLEQKYSYWPKYPVRTTLWAILKIWFDTVKARTGKKGLLYLNYSSYNYLKPFPSWFTEEYGLWLAWVSANPIPPEIQNIKFVQWSWKLDGYAYGCSSISVDGDYQINYVPPEIPGYSVYIPVVQA